MVFSLAIRFGLEIDHHQITYTVISTQVKNAVSTTSFCLFVGTDHQSIKEFKT